MPELDEALRMLHHLIDLFNISIDAGAPVDRRYMRSAVSEIVCLLTTVKEGIKENTP